MVWEYKIIFAFITNNYLDFIINKHCLYAYYYS